MQKKAIEEWLEDESNRELFFEWLKDWENEHPQFLTDTDKALERFWENVATNRNPVESVFARKPVYPGIKAWMVAASAVLLLAATFLLSNDVFLYRTYRTAFGEVQTFILADGSRVVLNANSSLRVSRFGFMRGRREVHLIGEAEFSVKHTASHQKFIVETPSRMSVEVLGTQFVVYARDRGSKVVLKTGKVRINDGGKQSFTIVPGEVVTFDKKGVFQKQSNQRVQVYSAWKDRRFIFDHTPLREVAYVLEENFGVKVQMTDTALANRSISGTFKASNAKEMLDILSDASNLRITKQNQAHYILSPDE